MKFKLGPWVVGDMYKKKSHKAYYCVVTHPDKRREERRLGEDKNGAEGRRAEIIAAIRREGVPSLDSLVRDLVFQFLDYSKANNSHKTYLGYKTYWRASARAFSRRPCGSATCCRPRSICGSRSATPPRPPTPIHGTTPWSPSSGSSTGR